MTDLAAVLISGSQKSIVWIQEIHRLSRPQVRCSMRYAIVFVVWERCGWMTGGGVTVSLLSSQTDDRIRLVADVFTPTDDRRRRRKPAKEEIEIDVESLASYKNQSTETELRRPLAPPPLRLVFGRNADLLLLLLHCCDSEMVTRRGVGKDRL